MSENRRLAGSFGILLLMADVGWELAFREDSFASMTVSNVLQTAAALFAAILLLIACHKSNGSKYWMLYALSAVLCFAAQAYWTADLAVTGRKPGMIGIPEVLWAAQLVLILAGLHLQNRSAGLKLSPFLRDILLFATVSIALYWQLFIRPMSGESGQNDIWAYYNLGTSALNLLILTCWIMFDRAAVADGLRYWMIAAYSLRIFGSTLSWMLEGRPEWLSYGRSVTEACLTASLICMGFAGLFGTGEPRPPKRPYAGTVLLKRHLPLVFGGALLLLLLAGTCPPAPASFSCLLGAMLMLIRLVYAVRELESVNQALWETNQTYQNWTENALVGVFIQQDDKLVYTNRHFEEIFGYERGQMRGQSILHFIAANDVPKFMEQVGKLHENLPTTRFEVGGFRRDQAPLYLELHLSKTGFQRKTSLSGSLIDITERKMSEQYLIRSEKLSVVGQLAAGVAHEIRNPLTALKGFTQLLHRNADENRQYYEIMLTELERINYIVGEFMVLSKPYNRQQLKEHDLHRILMSIIPILESQAILHNVIIRIEPAEGLSLVKCDENQIKQVLINLMKNAIEAMPAGGTVTVRFENDISRRELTVFIEDQGEGMPPELLERLGEPFLTTKEKGTGLGLMVCYKIIQAHEGALSVSSQPGQGTSVKLVLPAR